MGSGDLFKFFIFLVAVSVISAGLKTVWDWLFLLFIAGLAIYHLLKKGDIL